MRDRREQFLKLLCLVLGVVLAFQLTRFVVKGNPTKALVVPALPSLPPDAEAQPTKGTNLANLKGSGQKTTNGAPSESSSKKSTNSVAGQASEKKAGTNSISVNAALPSKTNSVLLGAQKTKAIESATAKPLENKTNNSIAELATNGKPNNSVTVLSSARNGSNASGISFGPKGGTNSSARVSAMMGGLPGGRPGMPGKPPELPVEIKERVERITQGEILAPVIRPMPMALLGIAGQNAFLRSAEGQTGMIKEGEQVGTIKLLRIGTNRVLIEHEGEKKELTIFAGMGSETLLPNKEKKPNETTNKPPENPSPANRASP